MTDSRWEDQFSAPERWARRVLRALSWRRRQQRNILIELRWRLGDELMALPVLQGLRQAYPQERITLLTNYPELFACAGVADAVNEALPRVDRYVFLRDAPRTVKRLDHYARLAGVQPVHGQLLQLGAMDPALHAHLPAGSGPLIALAPGASWPIKRWPREQWQILVNELRSRGARLIGLGQGDEHLPGVHLDLVGATTAREAGHVLAASDLLVCCDSGLMHLALAVGTPAVALFGPTDPAFLSDSPLLHPVRSQEECSGFWNRRREVPSPGICYRGHDSCLACLSANAVLEQAMGIVKLR